MTRRRELGTGNWRASAIAAAALAFACLCALLAGAPPAGGAYSDLTLASRAGGLPSPAAGGNSEVPSISDDGCRVAFESNGGSLDVGDANGNVSDVFVRDICANTTRLVSRADGAGGTVGAGGSFDPEISADGRWVVFTTSNDLEASDVNGLSDVYIRDLLTDQTELVSWNFDNTGAVGGANSPSVSGNGRFVAYDSSTDAATIVVGATDANGSQDVFLRDRTGADNYLISGTAADPAITGDTIAAGASVSGDGTMIAFSSLSTDLVPGDAGGIKDVFARNTVTAATTLISRADGAAGSQGNDGSENAQISTDGTAVVYESDANNLDPGDPSADRDIYVRELAGNDTELVSRRAGSDGVQAIDDTFGSSISADGNFVAFAAIDLTLADPTATVPLAVYLRDRADQTNELISRRQGASGVPADGDSRGPSVSGDGRFVAFQSDADNLSAEDNDAFTNIFVREMGAPPPVQGQRGNLAPVSGQVQIKRPGATYVPLEGEESVPVGSLIDARHGTFSITTRTRGELQRAIFFAGVLRFGQRRRDGLVTMKLAGQLENCGRGKPRDGAGPAGRHRYRGRYAWGSGRGRHSIRGQRSAATVRGTTWRVADRCNGSTLTFVKREPGRHSVVIDDFGKPGARNVVLGEGERYLAAPRRRR